MDLLAQAREGFQTIEVDEDVKAQALKFLDQWLRDAAFAPYRPQLEWLILERQWTGLLDRFYQILPFGTGGRRGPVGIGPNRMNPWTLGASVQGHCEYLKERFPEVGALHVVLACDVRCFKDTRKNYNPELKNPVLGLSSRDLAHHAAGVYLANGIHAHLLPADSPRFFATPELSFIIRHLRAHGGLNISASHNPPDDNGGKFYDERGGQPVAPDDQIMADLVEQVTTIKSLSWAEVLRSNRVHWLDDTVHQKYLDLLHKQSLLSPPRFDEMRIVFTPLHGVGAMTAMELLVNQGFRVTPVEEQMRPDGQFPNVTKSPNPEIPESMDRAEAVGKRVEADLVLATDPDADRLGSLAPDGNGGFRFLTGNEIAAMLTHFKLSQLSQQGQLSRSAIVITTEVTTSLMTKIAHHFRSQIVNNLLVGFKYHADVLWHLESEGGYEEIRGTLQDFVIATEESHGILVTPHIRDKDAAGAALLMAELALFQKRQHRTVLDYLEAIYRQFGYHHNVGVPMFMAGILGKKNMGRMLDALRADPPREIAGLAVTEFEDLRDDKGRLGPIRGATDYSARNFLIFRLGDRGKVVLRPSGTEPKAKAYIEVCSPPARSTDAWQNDRHDVDELAKRVTREFLGHALGLIGLDLSAAGIK